MDQAWLRSGDGGADGGLALRSTTQALSGTSLCGSVAGLQAGSAWAMRGGCPGGGSRSLELGPLTPVQNWGFDSLSDIRSSPVLTAANEVIVGGDNGKLYKVQAATGTILKEVNLGTPLRSTPAISATNSVYVGGENGQFKAFDLSSFALKWTYNAGGATSSPAILADGTVVFGSASKKVFALTSAGTQRWVYPKTGVMTGSAATSAPAVSPDGLRVHIGTSDGNLLTLNASTGALIKTTKLVRAVVSSPAITKLGLVVVGSGSVIYGIDSVAGTIVWQRTLAGTVASPAVSAEGTVRVGVNKGWFGGGSFYSLRAADGTILYNVDTLGGIEVTPVIDANDSSYFGANDGVILGVSSTGRIFFKHVLPNGALAGVRSSAVIAEGQIIFGGDDNWLRSVGTGAPPALLPEGGTCSTDTDCEQGLICGLGNGARFGKPAGTNACWVPSCENKVKDPLETEVDCGGPCGSCTNICSQACTLGSQVTPPALEVLSFSQGAFTRSSVGTYQTGANTLVVARGDQLRYEDRGDGNGRVALFEGPRTNRMVWSEAMGNSPSWWTGALPQSPTMTLTEDAAVSPSGTMTADRWVAQTGANAARAQTIINAMPAGSLSTWLRLTDPASFNAASPLKTRVVLTDLTGGWYNEVLDFTLPAAWERRSMVTTPATKSTAVQMSHKPAWPGNATQFPALAAADYAVWGWQLEEGRFPSSYIPTQESALTRKVDRLVFTATDVPAWVRTGIWQIDVLPLYSSAEIATTDEFVLMAWEGGHISLGKDATGGIIKVVRGTTVVKRTIGWARNTKLTLTVNATARTLQILGASAGDGTLSYGATAVGTGRVALGSLLDGTKSAFARVSEIRKVVSATVACVPDPDCVICGDGVKTEPAEECDTALDAHCSHDCKQVNSGPAIGHSDADCPAGQVLLTHGGSRFGGLATQDVCWPAGICPAACGTTASPCGLCITAPNCAGKKCGDDSSDGAGGQCTNLCQPRELGCRRDSDCTSGFTCGIGMGPRLGKPEGTNICWPIACDDYMPQRRDCGTVSSLCGLCPTLPNECEDRRCGTDQYGRSCGTCASGLRCGAEGQCIAPVLLKNPVDPSIIAAILPVPTSPAGTIAGTFAVSDAGTATYSVPLAVPPGRAGLQPALSLAYDSGRGEGFLTAGWSLTGLSAITRCPLTYAQNGEARGVRLDAQDRFCLDGKQLVVTSQKLNGGYDTYGAEGTQYRTELDSFIRVVSVGDPMSGSFYRGPSSFKAWTKDGRTLTFGKKKSARVWAKITNDPKYSPSEPVNAAWMLEKIEDRHGNSMTVSYEQFTHSYDARPGYLDPKMGSTFSYATEVRPFAIGYGAGGSHRVEIIYSDDHSKTLGSNPRAFTGGIGRSFSQPLEEVNTFINDEKVSTYKFGIESVQGLWKLTSLTACASQQGTQTCHPPTIFEYEPLVPISRVDASDPLGGHIQLSHVFKDTDIWGSDRRVFMPANYERYFALPINLNNDAHDDLVNLQFTGGGKEVSRFYQMNIDLYRRTSLPELDGGRAFSNAVPWVRDPSQEWTANLDALSKSYRSILSPKERPKSYIPVDTDGDGQDDELVLAHPSEMPDLNGDGLRDKVSCIPAERPAAGAPWPTEWSFSLAIAPATPGGKLRYGPVKRASLQMQCNFSSCCAPT